MRLIGRCAAYSLYELLVTLGLVAIVLTIGLPSLGSIVANARLRTETDALFHAVHLARKESVVRRRAVTLCPTLDGRDCSGEYDWSPGWMMFINLDRDWPARRDPDEPVLKRHQVASATRIVANRRGFTLRSTELRATNGTFIICDQTSQATTRALVVSYTGRPRVAYRDTRGRPYRCSR